MKMLFVGAAALALSGCIVIHAGPDDFEEMSWSEVENAEFDGVALRGGGDLLIRHGDAYSFENTGTADDWKVGVKDNTLIVSCDRSCRGGGTRSATITLPSLENLVITGGGEVDVEGDFPGARELNIAITGGGDIDAKAVPADEVNVALTGGGEIDVTAINELNVSIIGGGAINYVGAPEVHKTVLGGGSVDRIRG